MLEVAGVQPTLLAGLDTALAGIVVTIVARQARSYKAGATFTPDSAADSDRHLYQSAGWTTGARAVATRALGHRLQPQ